MISRAIQGGSIARKASARRAAVRSKMNARGSGVIESIVSSSTSSPAPATLRPFLEAIRTSVLVVDGAMGTQIYERGILFTVNYEELNLSRPELVTKIHEEYVRAGAQVVETNTFGANPTRLARHGLDAKVRDINAAGVRVARQAA